MRERPIIFTGDSVRAILGGRKTQSRRVASGYASDGSRVCSEQQACPYGTVGSRLWVRETWAQADLRHSIVPVLYRADGDAQPVLDDRWRSPIHMPRWASRLTLEILSVRVERVQAISEADARAEGVEPLPLQAGEPGAWWTASVSAGAVLHGRTPADAFRLAWDAINGRRAGCSWAASPWVWVLEFRRVEAT